MDELAASDERLNDAIEPAHFAASIVGATLVYGVALPSVVSDLAQAEGHEHHRNEVLRITRRLLGGDAGGPQQDFE